jgi:hypothetical protein
VILQPFSGVSIKRGKYELATAAALKLVAEADASASAIVFVIFHF